MEYTHKCIKCSEFYTDTDPDAYYCSPCNEARLAIAKEVDAKLAALPKKEQKSDLQVYNELIARNKTPFVKAGDLGIKMS